MPDEERVRIIAAPQRGIMTSDDIVFARAYTC